MNDRWLSVTEICTYLGIKRDTVYKCISEKNILSKFENIIFLP